MSEMQPSPNTSMRSVALVTGASGGIGADIARVLAARGFDVALTARTQTALEALADELAPTAAKNGFARPLVIALDLAAANAPEALCAALQAAHAQVQILVNNAGYGLMGEMAALDRADQLGIIDLNVRSLVDLTLILLPDITASRGKIMNVASVAAFFPGPGMAVYYASKAFVLSFSDALAQELRARGVVVTALCPGVTTSGFGKRAGVHADVTRHAPAMDSMSVAEAGVTALLSGRRRVVPGLINRLVSLLSCILPTDLVLPIIYKIQVARRLPTGLSALMAKD